MKRFVCGFAFNSPNYYEASVALIEKKRPEWQVGKLNGIGGHIETGETIREAMAREFTEEAGVPTHPEVWRHVCTLVCEGQWQVTFLTTVLGAREWSQVKTMTDEMVIKVDAWEHGIPVIGKRIFNLEWLIPMCFDSEVSPFVIRSMEQT